MELAQRARTVAHTGNATPTVLSVLAAREAVGHAMSGDRGAATSAMSEARRQLDHGRSAKDPLWVGFWTPADLAWHETHVALATGNRQLAEKSARFAFDSADADAFPRNHTLYAVGLGSVLTGLGRFDEAIHVTSGAVQRADTISGSQRVNADLRQAVTILGKQNYAPAHEFAGAARQLLAT
ncbi:MAG: hypothetical protein ACRDQ5_09375 [Sciscionella sp.]